MLSVSICRRTRVRLAPIAARIAISFCRAALRARRRLATFAQAMRSTNPTAPSSARRDGFTSRTSRSWSVEREHVPTVVRLVKLLVELRSDGAEDEFGPASDRYRHLDARSPTTRGYPAVLTERLTRSGTQIWVCSGYSNPGGITPMIIKGLELELDLFPDDGRDQIRSGASTIRD